ncbi:MAG: type II secretion system major pseudopilin GspG [Sedimenticola sp.]
MCGERIKPQISGTGYSRGFTLIEIMVVVVILSILAAMVVPKIMSRPDEARAVRVQQDIRALGASLNLFRLDNFSYPTTEQGLESLAVKPGGLPSGANWKSGGYIERIPKDPWGAPYRYLQPGSHGEFDLYSLGADGVAGGTDAGKDIGNWNLD